LTLTRVDFYHNVRDIIRFACRITRKLYYEKIINSEKPLIIRCQDRPHCKLVSESLNYFSSKDFLPYAEFSDRNASVSPIILSVKSEIPFWAEDLLVLVNLDSVIESTFSSYTRVIEIVDQTDLNRQQGREKYMFYKERGYAVFDHKVNQ